MTKKILFAVLGMLLLTVTKAQDVDYTNLLVNNSFEYAWEGQVAQSGIEGWTSGTWRPWLSTNINHKEFYGWNVTDWNFRSSTNTSQSLESSGINKDQTFNIAIFGDKKFDEIWELYQIIDKDALPAGIYKIEARLAVRSDRRTTQRLFANQRVQYYGPETNYTKAQMTAGETATFAGWAAANDELKDMVVYTSIGEDESLKFGIRTGGKKMDGTMAADNGTIYGCFKADYFRLTKLDPANPMITDAKLASLSVNTGIASCTLVPAFDPEVTTYSCQLPKGTANVTLTFQANFEGATVNGANTVTINEGTGVSTIVVTAIDGVTAKTYTINYSCAENGSTDLTNLIVNNSFEYACDGTMLDANGDQVVDDSHAAKGKDGNGYRVKNSVEKQFYGWSVTNWDFATATNNSQGMNRDYSPINKLHGSFGVWLGGDLTFKVDGLDTNSFEFYQTIDKENLSAGTYKVQCLLAVEDGKRTSQRLFANQSVQYHGTQAQYAANQTAGEVATFAGWPSGTSNLQEMKVYSTIGEEESLKFGIRTGDIKGDGTIAASSNPLWGWFKVDYFRLVKLDPADAANADLSNITLSAGTLTFDAATTSYNVQLPGETTSVTATATAAMEDVKVTGAGAVDVSSGSGVSTITVTALDGTTTKTYSINYSVGGTTNLKGLNENLSYRVTDRKLSVYGCNAYSVFSLSGTRVAEVKNNTDGTSVVLLQGAYIVKTAGVAPIVTKVIVK